MYKYTYINTKTGEKTYSNEKLDRKDLKLISYIKSSDMKSKEINQK